MKSDVNELGETVGWVFDKVQRNSNTNLDQRSEIICTGSRRLNACVIIKYIYSILFQLILPKCSLLPVRHTNLSYETSKILCVLRDSVHDRNE